MNLSRRHNSVNLSRSHGFFLWTEKGRMIYLALIISNQWNGWSSNCNFLKMETNLPCIESLNQNKIRKNSVPDLKQTETKFVNYIISQRSIPCLEPTSIEFFWWFSTSKKAYPIFLFIWVGLDIARASHEFQVYYLTLLQNQFWNVQCLTLQQSIDNFLQTSHLLAGGSRDH